MALSVFGVASAVPVSATPLIWAKAQAWVADGDLVTGYSTAIGFSGDLDDQSASDPLSGSLAEYARVEGESRSLVEDRSGASAQARVDRARVRVGVEDLIELGMIGVPEGVDQPSVETSERPEETEGERGTSEGPNAPTDDSDDGERQRADEPAPRAPFPESETSPSASPTPEDVVLLGEGESENVSTDGNTVEFTVEDVRGTATAGYDGRTEASLEYGELTAFGAPVPGAGDEGGEYVAEEVLEVFDADGETVDEVPVGIRFLVQESTFEDDHEDWEGRGIRSALTVWVQIGDPEDGKGFAVDFAHVWAIGSTHVVGAEADPDGDEPADAAQDRITSPSNRLATTGGSVAALITAAVVAVGGGVSATFLARKRTTAMDDRIED
ncbi:hypothetical protein [Nocardiopsis alkaliphila]|uniref:hypothetical protein n=1 Tax=Nocardiopsis alkaliphila TaxID=225762 RepID=UPI000365318A|nr:hypothetical protein [Nocardiopsis alkaliphila]